MKRLAIILLITFSLTAHGQKNAGGIKFENGTWQEVLAKAKISGKSVFVDCYATWCLPCKEMDKRVYTNDSVGELFNERFISVKMQMDSSKGDNRDVLSLFPTAREFERKYKISGVPTFLFFSNEGVALHKSVGGKSVQEFIELGLDALDSEKQIYTKINKAVTGKTPITQVLSFIKELALQGEDSLKRVVARYYIKEYLNTLSEDQLLNLESLKFIQLAGYSSVSSGDGLFKVVFKHPSITDSILSIRGFAKDFVTSVITREDIKPHLRNSVNETWHPDWVAISRSLSTKYPVEIVNYIIVDAKIDWYRSTKNWSAFSKAISQKWKQYENEFANYDAVYLNGLAYKICVHRSDKKSLKVALSLVNLALSKEDKPNIAMLDTRANIFYKIGDTKLALKDMKIVVDINKKESKGTEWDAKAIAFFQDRLDRMQRNLPVQLE